MSLVNEHYVVLVSNVKGNDKNKPASFTTQLAAKLDLPGQWKVALVDISYPNNWINVPKVIRGSIKTKETPAEFANAVSSMSPDVRAQYVIPFRERVLFRLPAGQYSIAQIVGVLKEKIISITPSQASDVKVFFNETSQRITIRPNFDIKIGCEDTSFFSLIGFEPDVAINELPNDPEKNLKLFGGVDNTGTKSPQFTHLTTLFVYTDIIKPGHVGDTLTPLLTYLPITSKYGEPGFWDCTRPKYKSVNQQEISNIYIHIATNTGVEVPFTGDTVTCTLHFKRIR